MTRDEDYKSCWYISQIELHYLFHIHNASLEKNLIDMPSEGSCKDSISIAKTFGNSYW